MEPFLTTTDTFAIFSKNTTTIKHYAITPLLGNKPAVRTYTFNYETAGTGCYVKSFLADLTFSNEGELRLELGTMLRIKSIGFEKQAANGFVLLDKTTNITGLQYNSIDKTIRPGSYIYRAVLELTDGRLIYSSTAIIYFVGANPAVVYPNPVQRNGSLTVLAEQDEALQFQLIDNYGRVVLQKQLTDYPQQISLLNLSKGIYYFRLLKKNKKVQSGRLIIN
jgi:hypothetical protein